MSTKPPTARPARKTKPAKATDEPAAKARPAPGRARAMNEARYRVGDVVKHRIYPFRGIIFDIDPVFNSTEEWWQSIPEEVRPRKDQPFYHLLAENAETEYVAYVSEQNLLPDLSGQPLRHPKVPELFVEGDDGRYVATFMRQH
jgi:heat shock protein HspQ